MMYVKCPWCYYFVKTPVLGNVKCELNQFPRSFTDSCFDFTPKDEEGKQ